MDKSKREDKAEPISISTAWLYLEEPYEEQEEELRKALSEAGALRYWAVEEMRRRWSVVQGTAKVTDLIVDAAKWLRDQEYSLQHYTMVSTLNRAVADFNNEIVVENNGVAGQVQAVLLPSPYAKPMYSQEVVIQSRAVWTRYLATYNRISTTYGNLYLQNGWEWEVEQMAEKMEIPARLVPYLIYSATIKLENKNWMIRFNIHHPNSGFGRPRRIAGRKKLKEL